MLWRNNPRNCRCWKRKEESWEPSANCPSTNSVAPCPGFRRKKTSKDCKQTSQQLYILSVTGWKSSIHVNFPAAQPKLPIFRTPSLQPAIRRLPTPTPEVEMAATNLGTSRISQGIIRSEFKGWQFEKSFTFREPQIDKSSWGSQDVMKNLNKLLRVPGEFSWTSRATMEEKSHL